MGGRGDWEISKVEKRIDRRDILVRPEVGALAFEILVRNPWGKEVTF
jgi:hypothetical protein